MEKKTVNRKKVLRAAFFPLYFVWAELLLHLWMDRGFSYAHIYLLFALSAGAVVTLITLPFPERPARIIMIILSAALPFAYGAEIIARRILQAYYLVSMIATAAGNDVFGGYGDLIRAEFMRSLSVIILLFAPCVIFLIGGKRLTDCERPHRKRVYAYAAVFAAAAHLAALLICALPVYGSTLTPLQLYLSDTEIEDTVNELGFITAVGIDEVYMFVDPPSNLSSDFSSLEGLEEGRGAGVSGETGEAAADETAETEAPGPVVRPQVLDIDLDSLAAGGDADTAWLAQYFASSAPSDTNEYTGAFEGYNVIELVLEGFTGYGIDEELTPTLWRLTHEGFVCENFYTALHYGSTSAGECQVLLGLYPKNGSPVTMPETGRRGTDLPFTLSQELGRAGYRVLGFHDNSNMYERDVSHPNLGLEWRYTLHGLASDSEEDPQSFEWPQRDSAMIANSAPLYLEAEGLSGEALPGNVTGRASAASPFYVYYLTVSGHMTGQEGYGWTRVSEIWRGEVQSSERFAPLSSEAQAYEACALVEVDRALETLLGELEAAGELDRTLIVAAADHIPYSSVGAVGELAGREFGGDLTMLDESRIDFDVFRSSLILWAAGMEDGVVIEKPCCQVDILPTVLNLLGADFDSRMLAGRDILSDEEGLVIFASRSWLTDRGFFNRFTGSFTPAEGVTMTPEETETYVDAMNALVGYRLASTQMILDTDFYAQALGEEGRVTGRLGDDVPAPSEP